MVPNYNIKEIILWIKSELKGYYPLSETDSLSTLILCNKLNYSKTQLLVNFDRVLPTKIINEIDQIVNELKLYKPIQYILGCTTFYNLDFKISEGVLIPRPETEELVNWIIKENSKGFYTILDIGTGSGIIAISLSKNMPGSTVTAIDIADEPLKITQQNCKLNNVDVELIQYDVLNPPKKLNKTFDIIVSNPPYVTEKEKTMMHPNVLNYEPHLALFVPDNDPLVFYRHIIDIALDHLNSGGKIYFEINESFGTEVAILLEEKGFSEIVIQKDINNKNRMIRAVFK
jgi:release factor glutamine methyltransferase